MPDEEDTHEEIRFADLAPAIESACWTVVVLALFLRVVNGPAVTNDQWWIQAFLFTSTILGACSLRLYHVLISRTSR